MIENNVLDKLKCSINSHFCDTITKKLSCGHYICKKCVPSSWSTNNHRIECRFCKEINRFDLRNVPDTIDLKENFIKYTDEIARCTKRDLNQLSLRINGNK
jgi:hypothetical protein